MLSTADEKRSFRLLDEIWEAGGRSFDTAQVYGSGDCETSLGRWLVSRGVRDQAFVLSKGCHPTGEERQRVTPAHLEQDLNASLERYDGAPINLYLLHRDDLEVPVGEIVDALAGHQAAGRIDAYGGSNWSTPRMAEANRYAAAHDRPRFVASSPNYTLARVVEMPWPGCLTISGPRGKADRAWYSQQRMPVIAWSSLAHGFFSGRITRESLAGLSDPADKACARAYGSEDNFTRQDRVTQLSRQLGVSPSRLALAYLLTDEVQVLPIVGSATGAEYRDNRAALEVQLTAQQREWLDLRRDRPE